MMTLAELARWVLVHYLLFVACLLGALAGWAVVMAIPAGLPAPRPDQGYSPTGSPMAPGSTGVFRGHLVLVFGQSGEPVGVFVYAAGTIPGSGNPPIASMTNQTADPFGNPVKPGVESFNPASGGAAQLAAGALSLYFGTTGESPGTVAMESQAGELAINSGGQSGIDPQAGWLLQSQAAGGGQRIISAIADSVGLVGTTLTGSEISTNVGTISAPNATAIDFDQAVMDIANGKINLNMASPPNYPTSGKTLAQTQACLDGLITSMINRQLVA